MSDPILEIDVAGWVERARNKPATHRQRQAIEVILNAIATTVPLNTGFYLKGGILMGLAYDSPRLTMDVDLTSRLAASENVEGLIRNLDDVFPDVVTTLGYTDLVVKTNSIRRLPRRGNFETAQFPALQLKIGYATRGTRQERALLDGMAATVIAVDVSFNEPTKAIQILHLTGGEELRAYSLIDLIAEKYRAMLQQAVRKRNRRQDVYDLRLLIDEQEIDEDCRAQILDTLLEKSRSRHLEPTRDGLDDPEVKRRSSVEWDTLELELGEVPDFETCYERVRDFYRNLPWDE